MTGVTEFLVMATVACLGIILCLDWMDIDEIAAMTFGHIITAEVIHRQVGVYPATLMAIQTVRLVVALGAIIAGLACQGPVTAHPVAIMGGGYTFSLVAAGTLGKLGFGIFLVGLLLSRRLLHIESRHQQKHTYKQQFLHSGTSFLEIVIERHTSGNVCAVTGIDIILNTAGYRHILRYFVFPAQPVPTGYLVSR